MAILIHVLASLLYVVTAACLWPRPRGIATRGIAAARGLLPLALAAHAIGLGIALATPGGLDFSFPNAVSTVAALCVLVTWASGFLRNLQGSASVVLPIAAVAALLPALFHNPHRFPYAGEHWATAHIAVALLAYAFLLVAATTALLMTALERRLHRGVADVEGDATPPLLTLERYLFRLVSAGFVLLTLALVSGVLFSEQVFGQAFTLSHKNVFSILAWLTFGALLLGRWRLGWRGRRAQNWILAGSAMLVLAYLGSKFVLEVVLGR